MLNQVSLVGRLTKDPELRFTKKGVAYVRFILAVQRRYRNAKGMYDTDFIPCTIWNKQAELTANYCHKGALVAVTGRIQVSQFINRHDERTFVTEVIGEDVRFLKLQPERRTSSKTVTS